MLEVRERCMRRTYTVHQKSSSPHTSTESLNPQLVCCAEVNNSTFILTIVTCVMMMPPSVTQTDLPATPGVADMITTFSTLLVPERTTSFTTSKVDIISWTLYHVWLQSSSFLLPLMLFQPSTEYHQLLPSQHLQLLQLMIPATSSIVATQSAPSASIVSGIYHVSYSCRFANHCTTVTHCRNLHH